MNGIHLCERCKYCTHSPNLFQPYYWCSWYGKEVKTPINRCDKITLKNKKEMREIKNLKIGELFSIRKNGAIYEFLGYCPIENLPIAFNRNKYETVYFEDENKKVHIA